MAEEKPPSVRSRHIAAVSGGVLAIVAIALCFFMGNKDNAIHVFTNTAAWGLVYVIVSGYGIGKAMELAVLIFKK